MFQVVSLLYSFLYTMGLLFYGPIRILQTLVRRQQIGLLGRLRPPACERPSASGKPTIWIHAVSVGEVNAIRPLVAALERCNFGLCVSTSTQTGQVQAKTLYGKNAQVFYFPLDWKQVCRSFLRAIDPDIVLLVETELWPNFIATARKEGVPLVLINGRISDQSFRSYSKFRFLLRPLLAGFSYFCLQSEQDLERILFLGAPAERADCVGNLKFDYHLVSNPEKEVMKNSFGTMIKGKSENALLVCGSTKPGEEKLLLSAFMSLRKDFPSLNLLIAPRHPHRGNEVAQLVREKGLRLLQRSKNGLDMTRSGEVDVLVLDSIGELPMLYQLADLVFIGGSLVPEGGQNVIEPAACGKPILFGPHMENFRQVAEVFVDAGAAVQVDSVDEFEKECRDLLKRRARGLELGRRAMKVVQQNRGAVKRTVGIIQRQLEDENRRA